MKYLFTLTTILAFFTWNTMQAQSTLLYEDFETTVVDADIDLNGWTNMPLQGNRAWIGKEYDQNKYAQATAYNSGEINEAWLITPELTLNGNNEFSFAVNIGYYTHDALSVYISTDFDGTDISGANWDDITNNFTIPQSPTGGYGTLDTAGTMPLTNYVGNQVHIAFVYNGNDNAGETTTIQVDNVEVTGTVGIETNKSDIQVNLYPNPAVSNIDITSNSFMKSITVFNVYGQKITNINDIDAEKHTLNVADLSSGMYFVNIKNTNGIHKTVNFIKE